MAFEESVVHGKAVVTFPVFDELTFGSKCLVRTAFDKTLLA